MAMRPHSKRACDMILFMLMTLFLSGCLTGQELTPEEIQALQLQRQHLFRTALRLAHENDRLRGLIETECRVKGDS